MNKRWKRWLIYQWNRYIPSTNKIVSLESKRLANFIAENYDYTQYPKLLDCIRENLLEHLKNESVNRLDNITINQKELKIIGDITNCLDDSNIIINLDNK